MIIYSFCPASVLTKHISTVSLSERLMLLDKHELLEQERKLKIHFVKNGPQIKYDTFEYCLELATQVEIHIGYFQQYEDFLIKLVLSRYVQKLSDRITFTFNDENEINMLLMSKLIQSKYS